MWINVGIIIPDPEPTVWSIVLNLLAYLDVSSHVFWHWIFATNLLLHDGHFNISCSGKMRHMVPTNHHPNMCAWISNVGKYGKVILYAGLPLLQSRTTWSIKIPVSGEIAVPDFVTECVVSVKMASHFQREIHRFIMSMISNYQKKTRYFDMFLACACPNIRILNDNPLYHLHMQQRLSQDFSFVQFCRGNCVWRFVNNVSLLPCPLRTGQLTWLGRECVHSSLPSNA